MQQNFVLKTRRFDGNFSAKRFLERSGRTDGITCPAGSNFADCYPSLWEGKNFPWNQYPVHRVPVSFWGLFFRYCRFDSQRQTDPLSLPWEVDCISAAYILYYFWNQKATIDAKGKGRIVSCRFAETWSFRCNRLILQKLGYGGLFFPSPMKYLPNKLLLNIPPVVVNQRSYTGFYADDTCITLFCHKRIDPLPEIYQPFFILDGIQDDVSDSLEPTVAAGEPNVS